MSHHSKCLNCNQNVSYSFCAHCGQKADTNRITFKHLVYHDLIHGVWHIEKGILFTLKSALFRPGKAAIEYIEGKRIRYYNIFNMILIFIGLLIFLETKLANLDIAYGVNLDLNPEDKFDVFLENYPTLFFCLFIPFFAFSGYVLFRK